MKEREREGGREGGRERHDITLQTNLISLSKSSTFPSILGKAELPIIGISVT